MVALRPPSWSPYPFAGADAGAAGATGTVGAAGAAGGEAVGAVCSDNGHHGGTVGCCPDRLGGKRAIVNGHGAIAVPSVGSAAAADPAARVTSTCGGGGCGRRRNDVDIGPERCFGVGYRFGVSSSVRANHAQTALSVEKVR